VSSGIALAVWAAVIALGAMFSACYDVPRPNCGFACGPGGACPDGYGCAADRYCHRIGAPADLVCMAPDALMAVDAAGDGRRDAAGGPAPDASRDAAIDATADAAVNAPQDAAGDAAGDAESNAAAAP